MHAVFEMIKYHKQKYPSDIPLSCEEITGHFDTTQITPKMPNYSLHTEYSYGSRSLSSNLYNKDSMIAISNKKGVPQLWKNKQWSLEFADFIISLTKDYNQPSIIEIHPPFDDYTLDLEDFVERYKVFENKILQAYPKTNILIENRCGSVYPSGNFVLSKIDSIISLSTIIDRDNLSLRFALDIPQLFTAHNCSNENDELYYLLLNKLCKIRHNIAGVHLWGKRKSQTGRKVSHCGDLSSYFDNNQTILNNFLKHLHDLFADNVARKLVLEVNSENDDVLSIINDLKSANISFV